MARGILMGLPVDRIEAIRDQAIANLSGGGTVQTSWSIGENSSGKTIAISPADLLEECNYALGRLAPDKYPALKPITRKLAQF